MLTVSVPSVDVGAVFCVVESLACELYRGGCITVPAFTLQDLILEARSPVLAVLWEKTLTVTRREALCVIWITLLWTRGHFCCC